MWNEIKINCSQGLTNIIKLAEIINTLPLHSAECERGFSALANIKTTERANLKTDTLNSDLINTNRATE